MMDWKTELEMDGDAFNNTLKNALNTIYSPPSIHNSAIIQTQAFYSPKTNNLNNFTQDYEPSPPAQDGPISNRMFSHTFNHHNQGLPSLHIPPYDH